MLRRCLLLLAILGSASRSWAELPKPMVSGLNRPRSVAVAFNNRIFVCELGEDGKEGGGRIVEVKAAKAIPFVTGLQRPVSLASWQKWLFVLDDEKGVWRVDAAGKNELFASVEAFPKPVQRLQDLAVDEKGVLYVSESGEGRGSIFRIDAKAKVTLVTDAVDSQDGMVMEGVSHLLVLNRRSGELLRIRVADGQKTTVAAGLKAANGLAWDHHGQLFITGKDQVWGIHRPGLKPVVAAKGFKRAADPCLDPSGESILVPDVEAGTLTALPASIPGYEVDQSPLELRPVVAFPNLEWTGFQGISEEGKVMQLRPLSLTGARDGTNRNFVTIQQGTIHVFPNDPAAKKTKVFLDIEKKVLYLDKENEQGLLGLAFHPNYKTNGEFFVFYSLRHEKLTNVLSRFRVSKDDPDRADPDSEEELLRIKRPFWNHDGGTICFGPDGYLYLTLGDGGAANDPFKNGQKLDTLLAKVLRIDVDKKDPGKNYAIPKDNPFVGRDDALPEIWAYGFRNVWRMAFDRKTGKLWAADVGQNLYEEINIVTKGGNYGWSVRESFHPFSKEGVGPNKDMVDPIWEYHHDIGKSVTGGLVYRGKRLPELEGHYLYGDYITSRLWALRYDEDQGRVVANRPIHGNKDLIFSFGEDDEGEVYFLTPSVKGIFRFEPLEKK